MSNILNLINYNYCAVKRSMFIAIGLFGAMWAITLTTSFQFIALLPAACTAMVFESVFLNENKNNARKVIGILPVKRYQYVLSRYILLTAATFEFAAISFAVIKISDHITLFPLAKTLRITPSKIAVSFIGIALGLGLLIGPMHFFCHFAFSEDKANLAIVAFLIILALIAIAVMYFVCGDMNSVSDMLNKLPVKMADSPYKFAFTAGAFGLISDILFCWLSIIAVNRKEI